LHVVAISVWTGGVVALLVIILLRARENTPEQRRALGATVWRFSVTALVAVAVLVTSGTLQAFDRLVLINDLYETPYGIALAVKILLVAVALAIGAINLLRFGPRLRAGRRGRRGLIRDTVTESAIFIVIIVRVAGRTDVSTGFTCPVANTGGAASSRVATAPPYTLIVFTDPAQPLAGAPVSLFVVVIDQSGNPVTGKPVRATFAGPAQQS